MQCINDLVILAKNPARQRLHAQDRVARHGTPVQIAAAPSGDSTTTAALPSLSVLTWNLWFQVRQPTSTDLCNAWPVTGTPVALAADLRADSRSMSPTGVAQCRSHTHGLTQA